MLPVLYLSLIHIFDNHITTFRTQGYFHCVSQFVYIDKVTRIQEPYKKANRKFHPDDSVINVGGTLIGGGHFAVMAGPCSVETPEQVLETAKACKAAGATILRGGAFKPRTSPYSFQGMGPEGLELLELAKKETGLPIVSEVMDISQLQYFDNVDMLQIGARNMQNFTLLKEVGKLNKPVLLKRGLSATYEEWLMAAEYIMSEGNEQVVLCERGIRTFETKTRNTLDVTAIPMMHELSHLPIIMDPSHAAGMSRMVRPLSQMCIRDSTICTCRRFKTARYQPSKRQTRRVYQF